MSRGYDINSQLPLASGKKLEHIYSNQKTSTYNPESHEPVFTGNFDFGSSQWDKPFTTYNASQVTQGDIDEYRGQNQGKFSQYGNMLMNLFPNEIVLGTLKGLNDIPDAFRAMFSENGLASMANEDFVNNGSFYLGKAKEYISKEFPIYRTESSKGFSPLHWSWYMDNMPSVGSAAAMMIPGLGAGKAVGFVGNVVSKAATGVKLAKNASALLSSFGGAAMGNYLEWYQQMQPQAVQMKEKLLSTPKEDGSLMSEEEVDIILKDESFKNYINNLWNLPLDMIGMYHMFKPTGGAGMLTKSFWQTSGQQTRALAGKPSMVNTLISEMIPESLQESNNYFNQEKANRNVDIKLGLSSEEYSLSEAMADPEFWNATTWGGLGSLGFTGAQNVFRQISDNVAYNYNKDKQKFEDVAAENRKKYNIFSGVGKTLFTGQTRSEAEMYAKQQEILKPIMSNIVSLSKIKNIADMTGDKTVYDQARKGLETEHALTHMYNGTFGKYMDMVNKTSSILDEQYKAVEQELEKDPENKNLLEYQNEIRETQKLIEEGKPELLNKEQDFLSAQNIFNITDSNTISSFVRTKSEIRDVKKDMNTALGHANAIYNYDDTTKYLIGTTERMREIQNEIELLENKIGESTKSVLSFFDKKKIRQLQDKLSNLGKKSDGTFDVNIKEDELRVLAKKTLKLLSLEDNIKDLVNGKASEKIGIEDQILKEKKYESLKNYMFGNGVNKGIYDKVEEEYNEERLINMQPLNDKIIENQLENGIPIKDIASQAAANNASVSETAKTLLRDKIVNDVDKAIESVLPLLPNETNEGLKSALRSRDILDSVLVDEFGNYIFNAEEIMQILSPHLGYEQTIEKINSLNSKENKIRSEEDILLNILKSDIETIKSIVNNIANDSNNADGSLLRTMHRSLSDIHNFLINDKRYEEVDTTKLTEQVIKLESKIEDLFQEMSKRRANEEARQIEAYNSWMRSISSGLKTLGLKEVTTTKELNDALESIKNDPKVKTELVISLKKGLSKLSKLSGIPNSKDSVNLDAFISSSKLLGANPNIAGTPSFSKYQISLNIDDINVTEFVDRTVRQRQQAAAIIDQYKKVKGLQQLSGMVNSNISIKEVVEDISLWLKKNPTVAPFTEQDVVIRTALLYLFNEDIDIINLQGIGGTGKSKLATKIISDIFRERNGTDSVIAFGEGFRANEIINESLFGNQGNDLLSFNKDGSLKNEQAFEDAIRGKKLLVIDEIGRLNKEKYITISRVLSKIQRENQGLKILLTGDQNQLSGHLFPTMRIDNPGFDLTKQIVQLPAMSIPQRTNNTEVQRLQDIFNGAGNRNVFDDKLSYMHDSRDTNGVAHSSGPLEFETAISNKLLLNDKKKRAIITTDDKVQYYKTKFQDIDVLTVGEVEGNKTGNAHGVEYSEVFVDIEYTPRSMMGVLSYAKVNTMMYQALSRATDYVMVLSDNWNGSDSVNNIDNSSIAEEKQKKFAANRIAYETWIKEELSEMSDGKEEVIKQKDTGVIISEEETVVDVIDEEDREDGDILVDESIEEEEKNEVENIDAITYYAKVAPGAEYKYEGVSAVAEGSIVESYYRSNGENDGIHKVYVYQKPDGNYVEVLTRPVTISKEEAKKQGYFILPKESRVMPQGKPVSTGKVTYVHKLSSNYSKEGIPLNDTTIKKNEKIIKNKLNAKKIIGSDIITIDNKFIADNTITDKNPNGIIPRGFTLKKGRTYQIVTYDTKADKRKHYYILMDTNKMSLESTEVDIHGNITEGPLSTLNTFVGKVTDFEEQILELTGIELTYGSNEATEEKVGDSFISEGRIFMDLIDNTTIKEDGTIVLKSKLETSNAVIDILNKLDSEIKKSIVNQINDIRNGLYERKKETLINISNAKIVEGSENKYLVQGDSTRKPLGHNWRTIEGATSLGHVSEDVFKDYSIVAVGSKDMHYELRRTFEIEGIEPLKETPIVYHVLIAQNLVVIDGVLDFDGKPEIEIFLVADNKKDVGDYHNDKGGVQTIRQRKVSNLVFRNNRYNLSDIRENDIANIEAFNADILNSANEGINKRVRGPVQTAFNRIAKANRKIYLGEADKNNEGLYFETRKHITKRDGKDSINFISLTTFEGEKVFNKTNNEEGTLPLRAVLGLLLSTDESGVSTVNGNMGLKEQIRTSLIKKAFNPKEDANKTEVANLKSALSQKITSKFNDVVPTFALIDEQQEPISQEGISQTETAQDILTSINNILSQDISDKDKILKLSDLIIENEDSAIVIGKYIDSLESNANDITTETEEIDPNDVIDRDYIPKRITTSRTINVDQVFNIAKTYIKDLSKEEVVVLSAIEFEDQFGKMPIGKFVNGIIYLKENNDNTFDKETLKHEVFHKIFNQYLTPEAKNAILTVVRYSTEFAYVADNENREVTSYSDIELEEYISLLYQKYDRGERKTSDNPLMQFIYDILGWISDVIDTFYNTIKGNDKDSLYKLFRDINSGKVNTRMVNNSEVGRNSNLLLVTKHFRANTERSLEMYQQAKEFIKGLLYKYSVLNLDKPFSYIDNNGNVHSNDIGLHETLENIKYLSIARAKKAAANPTPENKFLEHLTIEKNGRYPVVEWIMSEVSNIDKEMLLEMKKLNAEKIRTEIADITSATLDNEITDNALKNWEKNISQELKEILSFIKKDDKFINSRRAFILVLNNLRRLDFRTYYKDWTTVLTQITEAKQGMSEGSYDYVTMSTIEDIIKKANELYKIGDRLYPWIDGLSFIGNKAYINGKILERGLDSTQWFEKILKEVKKSDSVMLGLEEFSKNPSDNFIVGYISRLYRKSQAEDIVGKLYHQLYSLVENNPYSLLESLKSYDGNTTGDVKLVKRNPNGILDATMMDLWSALYNLHIGAKNEDKVIKPKYNEIISILTNKQVAKEYKKKGGGLNAQGLKHVFNLLGYPFDPVGYKETELTSIATQLTNIFSYDSSTIMNEDFDVALSGSSNRIRNIASILIKNSELVRAQNYLNFEGKKIYLNVSGSWFYDVMTNILQGYNSRPDYLKADNYITRNNIFDQKAKNPINTIYEYNNVDGYTNTDKDYNIGLDKYTERTYHLTKFIGSFISTITVQKDDKLTYFQGTQTQADRKDMASVRVNILSKYDLLKGIKKASEFESERAKVLKDTRTNSNNLSAKKFNASPEEIYKRLEKEAEEDFNSFMESITYTNKSGKEVDELYKWESKITAAFNKVFGKEMQETQEVSLKDMTKQLFKVFSLNNYVNGYHLDMLLTGDPALLGKSGNMVKRMKMLKASGNKMLIGKGYANPTSDYAVFNDHEEFYNKLRDIDKSLSGLYDKKIDTTDGVTFVLPETMDEVRKGTRDESIGPLLKNVIAYVDNNGIPYYIKTATVELTDALIAMMPELNKQREMMRSSGIKHLIAKSSMKMSMPINEDIVNWGEPILKNHVRILDNQYYRVQSNPLSEAEYITNPSQMMYWLNTNGLSNEEAAIAYQADADIMNLQWKIYNDKRGIMNEDGIVNVDNLKKAIIANLGPDNEKITDMLYNGLSLNYPAITGKMTIQIASILSKQRTSIKHSGNKFVLAPAIGNYVYQIGDEVVSYDKLEDKESADMLFKLDSFQARNALINTVDLLTRPNGEEWVNQYLNEFDWVKSLSEEDKKIFDEHLQHYKDGKMLIPRKLRMRDSEGFTEVIMPREFAQKYDIKTGEKIILNAKISKLLSEAIGVRIPTTGIHSTIAIKVIGINESTNRIIAPDELVAIHGSDFDVDSLFIMKREVDEAGYPIGYTKEGVWDEDYEKEVEAMEEGKDKWKLQIALAKNKKFDAIQKVLTKQENREDMNKPISLAPVKHDTFEGISNNNYHQWLEMHDDTIDNFKEFFNEQLEKNVSIEIKKQLPALFNKKGKVHNVDYDALYEGIKKDKLVLSDEIIKQMMGSDVGVVTILKAAKGRYDIQEDRDMNRYSSQWKSFRENMDGKEGVGIQAAIMRNFAYTIYANKGKDIAVTKGKTEGGKTFTVMSKTYGPIKGGSKVFDNGDTLINSYVDNSKEQTTEYLNATGITMNFIAANVQKGMGLKEVSFLTNQPVLRTIGSILLYNDSAIMRYTKLIDEITGEVADSDITFKELLSGIQDTRTLDQMIKDKDKDALVIQRKVLRLFISNKKDVGTFRKIGNVISSLKEVPVTFTEIQDLLNDVNYINSDKSSLKTENSITSIPHINESVESVSLAQKILSQVMGKYNAKITAIVNKVMNVAGMDEDMLAEQEGISQQEEYVRNEFEGFMMSAILEILEKDGEITRSDKIGIDYNGKLVTDAQAKELDYKITFLSSKEVMIQEQIDKVKEILRNESVRKDNVFLMMFNISISSKPWNKGVQSLRYDAGTSLDPDFDIALQKGFMALPDEYKKAFRLYDLLVNKSRFGFKGYSTVVPVVGDKIGDAKTTSKWDNLKYFDTLYNDKLQYILSLDDISALASNFIHQYIFNNSDKLYTDLANGLKTDQKTIILDSMGNVKKDIYDVYEILSGERSLYAKKNETIYESQGLYVSDNKTYTIYKVIGKRNKIGSYTYNSAFETEKYIPGEIDKTIEPKIFNKLKNGSTREVSEYSYTKKEGINPAAVILENERIVVNPITGETIKITYERKVSVSGNNVKVTEIYTNPKIQYQYISNEVPFVDEQINDILELLSNKYGNIETSSEKFVEVLNKTLGYSVPRNNYPAAFIYNRKVYLNTTGYGHKIGLDTPIHEIAHIYINDLKESNPQLYRELVKELKSTDEGNAIIEKIRIARESNPELRNSVGLERDIIEEAVVTYIGRVGAKIVNGTLTQAEQSLWDKIMTFVKAFFGINKTSLTLQDIAKDILDPSKKISLYLSKEEKESILEEFKHCF